MSARRSLVFRAVFAGLLTAVYVWLCIDTLVRPHSFGFEFALVGAALLASAICLYTVASWQRHMLPPSMDLLVHFLFTAGCLTFPVTIFFFPACQLAVRQTAGGHVSVQLKQIGMAMHAYHDEHQHFPPHAIHGKNGQPLLSWRVALLPYLGHADLYRQFKLDEPWDSPHNLPLTAKMPDVFAMPAYFQTGGAANATYFQVFVGPGAAFEGKEGLSNREFTDGSAMTLLVVIAQDPVVWTKPDDLIFLPKALAPRLNELGGYHGSFALFADGSTRFIPAAWTDSDLRAVITRNGGEPMPVDF